jgi:N-acetylneuraminic acid mutarotase
LACSAVNNIIYAIGGYTTTSVATNEAYDPSTNTWSTKTSMPAARRGHSASMVNNIIYAIGGYTTANVATNEAYFS